MTILKTKVKL